MILVIEAMTIRKSYSYRENSIVNKETGIIYDPWPAVSYEFP